MRATWTRVYDDDVARDDDDVGEDDREDARVDDGEDDDARAWEPDNVPSLRASPVVPCCSGSAEAWAGSDSRIGVTFGASTIARSRSISPTGSGTRRRGSGAPTLPR